MKLYFKIAIAICLMSVILSACTEKQTENYAIVSGTLINTSDAEVKLTSQFTSISLDTVPPIKHLLKIDDKGSFIDTLYIDGNRVFSLRQDRSSVTFRIKPGQHLQLNSDFADIQNSTKFIGDASAVNNYLFKKEQIFERINSTYRESAKDDEATFIKKQEGYHKEYMQLLISTSGLSEEFISNEKKDIQYAKVHSYVGFAISYKRSQGKNGPKISSAVLDVISSANMQDYNEFKRSVTYQFLLRAYYGYEYSNSVANVWETDPIKQLQMISEIVTDKNILDELFIMCARMDIVRSPNLQAYYDYFISEVSNQHYKDVISKQYKDLIAIGPGQVSPTFTNYQNIDGGSNSLSDFRGKYVYIDVWATWCGPCRGEIPYLQKVEEQYHGNNNIVFISLSVDNRNDLKKWQDFVKEKELGGVQLLADKAFNSEFVNKYQIKGIPQFILIDPQGKIVDANAPRPSDSKLIDLFKELGI